MTIKSDLRAVRSALTVATLNPADLRANVRSLMEAQENLSITGRNLAGGSNSAIDSILGYMLMYVGKPLDGGELSVISGIRDYARRIRELRSMGYRIVCGNNVTRYEATLLRRLQIETLRPDQYVLLSKKQKLPARQVH